MQGSVNTGINMLRSIWTWSILWFCDQFIIISHFWGCKWRHENRFNITIMNFVFPSFSECWTYKGADESWFWLGSGDGTLSTHKFCIISSLSVPRKKKKKEDKKHQSGRKHDLSLCNLADIIQSLCREPSLHLTPVSTSSCISYSVWADGALKRQLRKSHSSFPSQTANYFYSHEMCDSDLRVKANHLQTSSWAVY